MGPGPSSLFYILFIIFIILFITSKFKSQELDTCVLCSAVMTWDWLRDVHSKLHE